jgi:DNA modification methylase
MRVVGRRMWCSTTPKPPNSTNNPAPSLAPEHRRAQRGPAPSAKTYRDRSTPTLGGASRFFPTFRYQAKAPGKERPKVEGVEPHPTVKPLELIRWLVRLVTPPGGVVLDPFVGSGTTIEACILEGFSCIAMESYEPYLASIRVRLERQGRLSTGG